MRPLILATATWLSVIAVTHAARADSCGHADLVSALPSEGDVSVPTDATLHAYYGTSADYLGEPVTLDHGAGAMERSELTATFDQNEGDLSAAPDRPLIPGDPYVVHWPGLRGIATANLGLGKDVHFTAGTGPDLAAPVFGGIARIDWDVERQHDPCTSAPEERYVFDLTLAPATDDGNALALLVFQTAGASVSPGASPKPVLVGAMPADGRVRVTRTLDDGVGQVCFAALARDLTGKVSTSGHPEACAKTATVPFFTGCQLAHAPARSTPVLALLLLCLLSPHRRARSRSPLPR